MAVVPLVGGFSLLLAAALLLHPLLRLQLIAAAGDCPLDFGWSNFTLAASACSSPVSRGGCCRYINAFVAVSIAHYANATGQLGVPLAFSDICLKSISDTFNLYGVPPNTVVACGLGQKIRVSYQCEGRETILEMMQSPNFIDVTNNCKMPLSVDSSCKRCLNSGILYLHHIVRADDNVTLSICRNALFVVLANQGHNMSAIDMAGCFFGVQGLSTVPVSETSLQPAVPAASPNFPPSPTLAKAPVQNLSATPLVKDRTGHLKLILGTGVVVIGVATLLLLILIILIRKKNKELHNGSSPIDTSWNSLPPTQTRKCEDGPSPMFRRFSYKETKRATDNFSIVIGKGGFGTIYKAQLNDGTIVAVKRMDKVSKQGEEDFCREMELLSRLHHRHLVALKGFCVEKDERFLVYEYMENGSLKDHLHTPGRNQLTWPDRLQIAVDVANALEYLHFYCNPPLCHRDIKSSNILLDENFVAKVADFGLAHASRSGTISFEPVNTDIRGTPGYMDPEYVVTQELTEKSDIYSYGVVLLEIVTGRKAIQDNKNVVEWSQKFMASSSNLSELVDLTIRDSVDSEQLQVVVDIIQWCTKREGRARPSIKQVLRLLTESLDPIDNDYPETMDDEGRFGNKESSRRRLMAYRNEAIPQSGDPRCLMSSSSTTRSYCSRSVLLEIGSPQSPPGTLSV